MAYWPACLIALVYCCLDAVLFRGSVFGSHTSCALGNGRQRALAWGLLLARLLARLNLHYWQSTAFCESPTAMLCTRVTSTSLISASQHGGGVLNNVSYIGSDKEVCLIRKSA